MNWDIVEGNWKQFKGKAKEQWGKLTDDDLDVIAGKRDQLAGRVQEAYGVSKDEAEKQIRDWEIATRICASKRPCLSTYRRRARSPGEGTARSWSV